VQSILLALWLASVTELNLVQSVDYVMLHAGEVLIRIELARPLTQRPSGFRTFHPAPRVVLELPETSVTDKKTIQPERGVVRSIRLLGHAKGTRVVIDLTGPATYEVAMEGKALLVTLRRTPPARPGDRWERFGAAPPQNVLRDLRFERGPSGEGRVLVNAAAMTGIEVRQQGRRLIVSFLDTGIEEASQRRLDVLDFATPIEAIETRSAGRDALLLIETSGAFEYSARQSDAEFTLSVAPSSR
jgi:type IV pilus assembly protein PilQ